MRGQGLPLSRLSRCKHDRARRKWVQAGALTHSKPLEGGTLTQGRIAAKGGEAGGAFPVGEAGLEPTASSRWSRICVASHCRWRQRDGLSIGGFGWRIGVGQSREQPCLSTGSRCPPERPLSRRVPIGHCSKTRVSSHLKQQRSQPRPTGWRHTTFSPPERKPRRGARRPPTPAPGPAGPPSSSRHAKVIHSLRAGHRPPWRAPC